VCLQLDGSSALARGATPPGVGTAVVDRAWPGNSLAISYLMSGRRSWWSFAATAAERIGGGLGADWVVWAAAGLLAAALALTGLIVLRTLVRDRPMPRL